MYIVVWSVAYQNKTETRSYAASLDDAWELWNWLVTRSAEEVTSEYRERQVREKKASVLTLFGTSPVTAVRVFTADGVEVCPELGVRGMLEPKVRS